MFPLIFSHHSDITPQTIAVPRLLLCKKQRLCSNIYSNELLEKIKDCFSSLFQFKRKFSKCIGTAFLYFWKRKCCFILGDGQAWLVLDDFSVLSVDRRGWTLLLSSLINIHFCISAGASGQKIHSRINAGFRLFSFA